MQQRRPAVTEAQLQQLVHRININAGTPLTAYDHGKAQVGHYHISFAYGRVALHQTTSTGGAVRDVFSLGHMPKRELYQRMQSAHFPREVKPTPEVAA